MTWSGKEISFIDLVGNDEGCRTGKVATRNRQLNKVIIFSIGMVKAVFVEKLHAWQRQLQLIEGSVFSIAVFSIHRISTAKKIRFLK
jgi:hypothetical protein